MHNDKYVELKTEITKCILNNEEYKNEFYNNNLFHEIINGILHSNTDEDTIECIVNTLYSYNQMLGTVITAVANTADEKTVQSLMSNLQNILEEDNK